MTRYRTRRGVSLVEVMITVAIVAVSGLSIVFSLMTGMHLEQSIREQNGAIRVAADTLEGSKREFFANLSSRTINNVVIDDRGTARTGDDVVGTATLRYFTADGTEVGIVGSPMPLELEMVRVEATVTWSPAGRGRARQQTIMLSTLLAP